MSEELKLKLEELEILSIKISYNINNGNYEGARKDGMYSKSGWLRLYEFTNFGK